MIELDILEASELCTGLSKPELENLGGLASVENAAQGQHIHTEGGQADEFYLLTDGLIELRFRLPGRASDKSTTISLVEPGGFFGWSALVPPHRYTLDAVCAAANNRFFVLQREPVLGLFRREPDLGYKVMSNLAGIMGRRFRSLQEEMVRDLGHNMMHGW
jgi:CRP-like cAMP-binding protein